MVAPQSSSKEPNPTIDAADAEQLGLLFDHVLRKYHLSRVQMTQELPLVAEWAIDEVATLQNSIVDKADTTEDDEELVETVQKVKTLLTDPTLCKALGNNYSLIAMFALPLQLAAIDRITDANCLCQAMQLTTETVFDPHAMAALKNNRRDFADFAMIRMQQRAKSLPPECEAFEAANNYMGDLQQNKEIVSLLSLQSLNKLGCIDTKTSGKILVRNLHTMVLFLAGQPCSHRLVGQLKGELDLGLKELAEHPTPQRAEDVAAIAHALGDVAASHGSKVEPA